MQDVLSDLGPPDEIFYKEEDKMRIHLASALEHQNSNSGNVALAARSGCGDYFYNFYSLGFDILFDSHTHTVRKIVVHSNFPNHHEFNRFTEMLLCVY